MKTYRYRTFGKVEGSRLQRLLNEQAAEGWRLHTSHCDSTGNQYVVIFEREVPTSDQGPDPMPGEKPDPSRREHR